MQKPLIFILNLKKFALFSHKIKDFLAWYYFFSYFCPTISCILYCARAANHSQRANLTQKIKQGIKHSWKRNKYNKTKKIRKELTMEKRITFIPPQTWRGRFLGTILTLVALLFGTTTTWAQDVYIRPGSGSVVTSVSSADDSGFILGLGALWRHEQLALSMTGSDRDAINESGEISQPSTVIGERDGMLTLVGGRRPSFLVVSLPKGYRITGYDLVLVNNLVGVDYAPGKNTGSGHNAFHHLNGNQNDNELTNGTSYGTMRFYETTAWTYDGTNSPATQGNYNLNDVRKIEPGDIGSTILATAANGSDINIDATTEDTNKEFTISRHNIEGANQLYFRLVKNYTHYGISIKSFHIFFTAEGDFDAPAEPSEVDHARRVVSYSFPTNKIDIGKMSELSQEGHEGDDDYTFFSYNFRNVTDLKAYTYIYQERAVQDGVPYELESDANGTITPHIYPVQFGTGDNAEHLFAFENDTYYVEPPVTIHTSSGNEAPIGYRIVGAKIEYLWKDATNITKTIPNGFYIVYDRVTTTSSGASTTHYYLGENLQFNTYNNANNRPVWHMDDDGNIYYNANNLRYLCCNGEGDTRTLTWSTDPESRWNLRTEDGNNIYYYSDGLNYYNMQAVVNANGVPTGSPQVVKDALNYLPYSEYQAGGHTVTTCEYSPGTYTLNIWDQKTGASIDASKSVSVTEAKAKSSNNYVLLENLNNDAIKFSISDLAEGKQALLKITLTLQALDPYINNMLVECKNLPKKLQMSQTFTASDFSVSGGSFIFYVPSDLVGQTMDISFADLYSNYGDNTYWGESASLTKSRYSFVTSDYFKGVSGNQVAGVTGFPVNDGLYDASYDPDAVYTTKVSTATAGNVRYKFNNAEDLGIDNEEEYSYLEEYPFSVNKYLDNYPNPDGATPATGKFEECHVVAGDGTQDAGSFFVFTADETRYNIAPTTDWQHRFYAFYRMDVKAVAKSYYPELEWTRVYDSALYTTKDADDNEVKGEKAQFGLKLLTKEKLDNGQVGDFVTGYLTVKEVNDAIAAAIEAENETPTGDVPTSRDQILYIDCSSLIGVYNYIKTEGGQPEPATLENLMEGLGTNALIYLPEDISTKLDNFAFYESNINSFRAANNIVLTDKQPFYSKYDIQIDPANSVTYERKISDDLNGQAENATIMLPFTLSLDGGVHTNPDETPAGSFTVNVMQGGADMKKNGSVDYGTAFFDAISGTVAEANTPYMIHVESTSADEDDDFSFVIAEKGAKIIATNIEGENNSNGTGWLHTGEENVSATYGKTSSSSTNYTTYKFTNKATFSGAKFDRAKSEDVFYFANNKYLDLHTLNKYDKDGNLQQYLYVYPFRGVYTYEKTTTGSTGSKRMQWFDISFEKFNNGVPTDIENAAADADLMVKAGKGIVTMSASRSQDVTIYSATGISMRRVNLNAGDTQTVTLPAGAYLVNGIKIIVK